MMRKTGAPVALVLACVGLTVASGCGGDGPPLVTVTGTVTRDGQPLEGAAVMFTPDPGNLAPRLAEAVTDADGKYGLRTDTRFGAGPGKYHVLIVPKPPASATAKANPALADDPYMASRSAAKAAGALHKGKWAQQPTEHAEDREVTTEQSQVHDFDLKIKTAEPTKG